MKTQCGFGSRTAGSSPIRRDRNMTIKAAHPMKRGKSCQEALSIKMEPSETPSSQSSLQFFSNSVDTTTFPPLELFNMSSMKIDISSSQTSQTDGNFSHCSPMSNAYSSTVSSFRSSPEINDFSLEGNSAESILTSLNAEQLVNLPTAQADSDARAQRSEEFLHSTSQSVSELELDTSTEDTGITPEEIAAFMYGPRPEDNKWLCIFPGCTRTFGRKENIKSHVQTHLGDRQFICKVCGNDFVRQHDLKRHAKIHSGVKPYTCPCGRTFARHDALTRHRQRNTCDGGFEGISKTPIKRGRPKKSRLDVDKRLDKSAKTRQRALERAYPPSLSGSSEGSIPSPPYRFDDMETRGTTSPFEDIVSLQANLADFLSYTPPTSPSHSTEQLFSSQSSHHSYTPKGVSMSPSPQIMCIPEEPREMLPSHMMSRESSINYYSTPPELDISSSSPVLSTFLDLGGTSDAAASSSQVSHPSQNHDSSSSFMLSCSDHDVEQMFLDSLGDDPTMPSLNKDPMFLLNHFEDPFTSENPWQDGLDASSDKFFDSL